MRTARLPLPLLDVVASASSAPAWESKCAWIGLFGANPSHAIRMRAPGTASPAVTAADGCVVHVVQVELPSDPSALTRCFPAELGGMVTMTSALPVPVDAVTRVRLRTPFAESIVISIDSPDRNPRSV